MKKIGLFFLLLSYFPTAAQTTAGLVAYYPFNGNLDDATGNSANSGLHTGTPNYVCGLEGQALAFNGLSDRVAFIGPVNGSISADNFTVSFYFKSTGNAGTQYLVSKHRSDCAVDFSFFIRYRPATRTVNAVLIETPNKSVSIQHQLDDDKCWNLVTLTRDNNRVRLFINGAFVQEGITVGRIDLSNDGELLLGDSDCKGANETPFQGILEEFRLYNRALREEEIRGLYNPLRPDQILNPDTLIFLGTSVDIRLLKTCATNFSWSPVDGVSNPQAGEPVITPLVPGFITYRLRLSDNVFPCVATDSIRINVIDPNTLDCGAVYLPKAFTPNDDGLNDDFGISNPYALQELVSFEIFDRWGGRVFYTENPFERWDGAFQGRPVNSGVMLYKVVFRCNGEEKVTTGSVTILR